MSDGAPEGLSPTSPPDRRPALRMDIVTVFPEYLAPLDLSLIGKARRQGVLDVRAWDLRDFTHDRHRTVDDTPYGGGPGMIMRAEPWGEALDAVVASATPGGPQRPHLVVPSPAGYPFTQALAEQLAEEPWLVVACGRYEGIDERVIDDARRRMPVSVLSIGDYVLAGGEVAALVITEAVTRLVPGVMGNAQSLVEESHGDGLLEYPGYTRPPCWRDLDVPEVLLGGDHAAVARWRADQGRHRTVARRPDLLPASALVEAGGVELGPAEPADAPELWVLQRSCWVSEAQVNDNPFIPPLVESLDDVRLGLTAWTTLVARSGDRLVGSVRMRWGDDGGGEAWQIGRLMVAPDLQGRGLGRRLLSVAESLAPPEADCAVLVTGVGSQENIRRYRRAGYRPGHGGPSEPGMVRLVKRLRH